MSLFKRNLPSKSNSEICSCSCSCCNDDNDYAGDIEEINKRLDSYSENSDDIKVYALAGLVLGALALALAIWALVIAWDGDDSGSYYNTPHSQYRYDPEARTVPDNPFYYQK